MCLCWAGKDVEAGRRAVAGHPRPLGEEIALAVELWETSGLTRPWNDPIVDAAGFQTWLGYRVEPVGVDSI